MRKIKNLVNQKEHRYGLFLSDMSNILDVQYGQQYLENDNVQEILLYQINLVDSVTKSIYGQTKAKDKQYNPPIKLNVLIDIEAPTQGLHGDKGLIRDDVGNLVFGIYLSELEKRKIEINRGDIIKYNMSGNKSRYFEVSSANNVTDTSENSFGGFYTYWKKVIAVPAKSDTFNFDDETYIDLI